MLSAVVTATSRLILALAPAGSSRSPILSMHCLVGIESIRVSPYCVTVHALRLISSQGTLNHMSPELLVHGHASRASDVYAMGILLWEMATGGRAFSGENNSTYQT